MIATAFSLVRIASAACEMVRMSEPMMSGAGADVDAWWQLLCMSSNGSDDGVCIEAPDIIVPMLGVASTTPRASLRPLHALCSALRALCRTLCTRRVRALIII